MVINRGKSGGEGGGEDGEYEFLGEGERWKE
jgi:hypothetical protein